MVNFSYTNLRSVKVLHSKRYDSHHNTTRAILLSSTKEMKMFDPFTIAITVCFGSAALIGLYLAIKAIIPNETAGRREVDPNFYSAGTRANTRRNW
jgi:hypothetical protein